MTCAKGSGSKGCSGPRPTRSPPGGEDSLPAEVPAGKRGLARPAPPGLDLAPAEGEEHGLPHRTDLSPG